ncbi:hypothetical protein K502DRAFT_365854 [Neoconidiobolus thromboides FSU 785]|nr:hypothetical protein K502DRAFT_365854 [Neoconidiobolus thromboides FSU 785]
MALNNVASVGEAFNRLQAIFGTQQFRWFTGHLLVVLGTLFYVFSAFSFTKAYRLVYLSAMFSYGLVIYLTNQPFSLSVQYVQKVLIDDNSLYLLLATFWLFSRVLSFTLVPFFIFSLFHLAGYIRSNILPLLFPEIKKEIEEHKETKSYPAQLALALDVLKSRYYLKAIEIASFAEVSIIPALIFVNFLLRNTTSYAIIAYIFFLKVKASKSPQTRVAFGQLEKLVDSYVLTPKVPETVKTYYYKLKQFLSSVFPSTAATAAANRSQ